MQEIVKDTIQVLKHTSWFRACSLLFFLMWCNTTASTLNKIKFNYHKFQINDECSFLHLAMNCNCQPCIIYTLSYNRFGFSEYSAGTGRQIINHLKTFHSSN